MRYLQIALYRSYADLKTEASRSFVGFAWWIVEPLLYMLAFFVVFELGLRQGKENFLSFLLIGLIFWKWFASTITSSSNILNANRGLLNQVYLPKWVFPVTVVTTNTVKLLIALIVLFFFLQINGITAQAGWLGLLPVVMAQLLLVLGFSLVAAASTPFFQELRLIIDNGILALMFLSGVFYDLDDMESDVRSILILNPIAILLRDARSVLLGGQLPADHGLLYVTAIAVLLITLGLAILVRKDRIYPKVITS